MPLDDSKPALTYVSVPLLQLSAEREFPGPIYLCLQHKMVRYRNPGDTLDADAFNKLVYNQVKLVFIEDKDRETFKRWMTENEVAEHAELAKVEDEDTAPIIHAAADQRRAMMDIFENPRDDRQVKAAVETSKKLVTEFLRKPFAINNIASMQKYSKGVVDHAVNVSVLCVFLGLRMGYTHQIILENLALGGLFHDVGKTLVEPKGMDSDALSGDEDPSMQQHPKLGVDVIDKIREMPNEVRMIVAQHHEFLDGSGYPNRLKGLAVYDLARLVSIANIYDDLISKSAAKNMKDRALEALEKLETDYEGKLDPKKLEKVTKILRYSFL